MMYKKISFILILSLLSTFSCIANNTKGAIEIPEGFESFGGKKIFVKYEKPIEGYEVKALVYADSTVATGYRALLDFSKAGKTVSQIETTEFFLPDIRISELNNGEIVIANYDLPDVPHSGLIKLDVYENIPFFFLDVNFDGEKELILNKVGLGQRGMNAYKPINIEFPYYDFGSWETSNPYGELDDETIIDYDNKVIRTTSIMSSCCAWWISTFNRGEGEWVRTIEKHEIQYDEEDNPHEMIQTIMYPEEYTEWRLANPEECILTNY